MNKFHKKKLSKHKLWKEMNKNIQDLKVEIELIKKTESKGNLKNKNLGT